MDFLGLKMLVEVDIKRDQIENVLDCLNDDSKKQRYLNELGDMFTDLLKSSREGYHRIFINRKLCQWVFEYAGLREREKDQLLLIEEKSSQLGTSVKNAPCKLTIELGAKKIQQDGFNWRIGHKNFASNFKLKQITLLVENGKYDGQIYKHIFELVADKNKVGMVNFRPEHSGGKDFLPTWFEDLVKRDELVLCIGDQDCLAPTDHSNNNLVKKYRKLKSDEFIGFATLTPGNAIENFFPLTIVEILGSKANQSELARLKLLIANQKNVKHLDCMWLYFDIKNGMINPIKLEKCNSSQKKWLAEKYNVKLEEVSKISFRNFGDISKLILNNFENKKKTPIILEFEKFVKSEYWNLHLNSWFEPILWFLCGEDTTKLGTKVD